MPNVNRIISPWIGSGTPDTYNEAVSSTPGANLPYAGGETGMSFDWNNRTYEKVQLDSGATAATPTGVVAANQLAYWKDKSIGLVTNDRRVAQNNSVANASGNSVAGVFRNAVTPGNLCCILTTGTGIPVKAGTVTGAGQLLTSDVDANGPQCVGVAVGTAPGYQTIGKSLAAAGGGNVSADVYITPTLP